MALGRRWAPRSVLQQRARRGAHELHADHGPGRRVGKRCLASSARPRHTRRCKLTILAGTLTFTGHAGANIVNFDRVLAASRKLSLATTGCS